jgi:hypothetical protein
MVLRILAAAALLFWAGAVAAQESTEMRQATLEATAGQALFELGQMRAGVVQLKQQIEALKAKCGEACKTTPLTADDGGKPK